MTTIRLARPEKFDLKVAEQVLDQVTRKPRSHNQLIPMADRLCGSVGCIMGWGLFFAGVPVDYSPNSEWYQRLSNGRVMGLTNIWEYAYIYTEMDKGKALEKLRDYIEQAKIAQAVQDDYVLQTADDKELIDA
jgi:hypothetical protein